MAIDTKKYYAVITGDFIGFSDLPAAVRSRMPDVLIEAGRSLQKAFDTHLPEDVAVFRGDSWQALLPDPVKSLRTALFFRAAIRAADAAAGVDSRMAIGVGRIDYVPAGRVSAGDGPAFRRSGKILEKMTGPGRGRLRFAFPEIEDETMIDALVRLTGALGDRWSARQATAVIGALQGFSQAQIAAGWTHAISRQAVARHLARANWPAVAHALAVVENRLALCFKGTGKEKAT